MRFHFQPPGESPVEARLRSVLAVVLASVVLVTVFTAHADGTDPDGDGVPNSLDNCINLYNPDQCDSDGDGYGNRCDGDLNNDGATNDVDTPLYHAQLGQPSVGPTYNKADLNCNGFVNAFDTPLFRQLLGSPPGPSGLACAGIVPCP